MNNTSIILLLISFYMGILFWKIPKELRSIYIATFSTFFVFLLHPYILISFLFITVTTYIFSFIIERYRNKFLLIIFILLHISYFILFKDHFLDIISSSNFYYELTYRYGHILTPIGISFYTLQAISYLIDIFRKEISSEKSFLNLYNYMLFFPKFIQGPIESPKRFLEQLKSPKKPNEEASTFGLLLIFSGLFRKLILSETYLIFSSTILLNYKNYSMFTNFLAVITTNLVMYYDFSGYSRIARGIGLVFGIHLTENFRAPFFSSSFFEFWKNWHHSFFNYMRNYVFIPTYSFFINILPTSITLISSIVIVFFISALWHKLAWNWITFFLIHAFLLIFSFAIRVPLTRIYQRLKIKEESKWIKITQILIVFCVWNLTSIFVTMKEPIAAAEFVQHLIYGTSSFFKYLELKNIFLEIELTSLIHTPQFFIVILLTIVSLYYEYINKFCRVEVLKSRLFKNTYFLLFFFITNVCLFILYAKSATNNFIYSFF